ncbi:tissue-type plasminogen activator-like [Lampris incognitus]|uniref:tissue-type plasminogen activator-like n=1 Tax=Lampris incognitus TaxID=2546036 RepID=UPI0024B54CCA|nr:tissue-type plasminogen activator-like [Lampris incognitus]
MNLLVILTLTTISIDAVFSRDWSTKRFSQSPYGTSRGRSTRLCLDEDGRSYRGSVSVSAGGKRCLRWQRSEYEGRYAASVGLGPHNHCRNPDQSLMPWCHVKRGRRVVREFCSIPKCAMEKGPVATARPRVHTTRAVDTELTCGQKTERKQFKIVGGALTSTEAQPWMAAIFSQNSAFLCGGSLITPCWVLTAAHCFSDGENTQTRRMAVYLGKNAINETDVDREQRFNVERVIVHQKYSDDSYDHDIALVKLKGRGGACAVRTPTVRTACLPPALTMLPPGVECVVAGYGKESNRAWHYSKLLKQTKVSLLSQTKCSSISHYGSALTKNMFCAASPTWSTDACHGDSGGPLMCEVSGRMFVFGVVSWGEGCAQRNRPGVYTRVTNYNSWIAEQTGLPAFTAGVMYSTK